MPCIIDGTLATNGKASLLLIKKSMNFKETKKYFFIFIAILVSGIRFRAEKTDLRNKLESGFWREVLVPILTSEM